MWERTVFAGFAKTKSARRRGGRGRQPRHIEWISPRCRTAATASRQAGLIAGKTASHEVVAAAGREHRMGGFTREALVNSPTPRG